MAEQYEFSELYLYPYAKWWAKISTVSLTGPERDLNPFCDTSYVIC